MTRNIGKLNYFILKKENLEGLKDSDRISFLIGTKKFSILVSILRERFKTSVDWNKNGAHKQSSSIPKWIIEANNV